MMLQSKLSRQTQMYKQEVLLNKFSHILGSAILGSAILGSANLPFFYIIVDPVYCSINFVWLVDALVPTQWNWSIIENGP